MLRFFFTSLSVLAVGVVAYGQIKKQFTVEDIDACERISLTLIANSGNCFLRPGQSNDVLNVYSNLAEDNYSQDFQKEIIGKICNVSLALETRATERFGDAFTYRMFTPTQNRAEGQVWRMYLGNDKPYDLVLNYGMGRANIDLSGLAINKIKVHSASANVLVGYFSGLENRVEMDTFSIEVDWGNVRVENLALAKSRNVVADVGYGNMILDYRKKPSMENKVKCSLGMGSLTILLPEEEVPVLVKIQNSMLCTVQIPGNYTQFGNNAFASPSYSPQAQNPIIFDLDVSMGSINFR